MALLGNVYENSLPEGTSRTVLTADERFQLSSWLYAVSYFEPLDDGIDSTGISSPSQIAEDGFNFTKLWRWCIRCIRGDESRDDSSHFAGSVIYVDSQESDPEAYHTAAED